MKYVSISAFLLLAVLQWVIPGKSIMQKNHVLKDGQSYKFKTEPVDPSNPFKGKYIALNFAENSFTDTIHRDLAGNDPIYVILEVDTGGFAKIKNLSIQEPENTKGYVKASVYYTNTEKDSITVHLRYPFDEFYMDEYKAPKAENIYRESSRVATNTTYALVKVLNGEAVIENVFINDVAIGTLIK